MRKFNLVFSAELLKVRNTFAPWLILFAAFVVPFILFVEYMEHVKEINSVPEINPWDEGWSKCLKGSSIFIFPCVIVMETALLMNIEHRFNTWKYLLTLPVPTGFVYLSKLLINMILLAAFYILLIAFFLFFGWLFGYLYPKTGLLTQLPNFKSILHFSIKSFIAFLSVLSIHFWLSIRMRNMFINMGIGLVCIFMSIMTIKSPDIGIYYPYSFGLLTAFKEYLDEGFLARNEICSGCIFLGISVLSYIDFVKKYKG
jgi:lantibiotic transport system permease protein